MINREDQERGPHEHDGLPWHVHVGVFQADDEHDVHDGATLGHSHLLDGDFNSMATVIVEPARFEGAVVEEAMAGARRTFAQLAESARQRAEDRERIREAAEARRQIRALADADEVARAGALVSRGGMRYIGHAHGGMGHHEHRVHDGPTTETWDGHYHPIAESGTILPSKIVDMAIFQDALQRNSDSHRAAAAVAAGPGPSNLGRCPNPETGWYIDWDGKTLPYRALPPVLLAMLNERVRAHQKHDHPDSPSMERRPWDDPSWRDVVVEEVGEIARAFNDLRHSSTPDEAELLTQLRGELIQTAAMVWAWIDAVDEVDK